MKKIMEKVIGNKMTVSKRGCENLVNKVYLYNEIIRSLVCDAKKVQHEK
jgi:hypothetical protein